MASLPRGWSIPTKASEVDDLFPGVGTVYRYGPPKGWQSPGPQPLVSLLWSGVPRKTGQPVLLLWAAPSQHRHDLAQVIRHHVSPEAIDWIAAISDRGEGWRMLDHEIRWCWMQTDGTEVEVTTHAGTG